MIPRQGEVWLADLGLAAKTRPIIVMSRYDLNPPRSLIIYVPLTTQNRNSQYEILIPKLPFLDQISIANVQGLGSLPITRLERRLGKLPNEVIDKIKKAILFAMDIQI